MVTLNQGLHEIVLGKINDNYLFEYKIITIIKCQFSWYRSLEIKTLPN